MPSIKKVFPWGDYNVSIETGEIARQATGSVLINVEGTVVLVSVVCVKEAEPTADFFPLTVNYEEKAFAAGKIPGGFLKREGRPSEREILISRLIDRPIRPLFPKGFFNEVQITAVTLSVNPDVEPDIVAMIGTSAALAVSKIPFKGPIGAARVGYSQGQFLLNPSKKQLLKSDLDLVVAGTEQAVMMVESEAKILPEAVMLEAIWFGHQHMQPVIQAIKELEKEVNRPQWDWQSPAPNVSQQQAIAAIAEQELSRIYQIADKQERKQAIDTLRNQVVEKLVNPVEEEATQTTLEIQRSFEQLEKVIVRNRLLEGHPRIDGRDTRTVRPLNIQVGVLPRTHGSALFTRGETQALVVATLGTERDAQILESVMGEEKDRFLFHYNFPHYCVGETGPSGSPKRREVGHGRLAKRGIAAVLPSQEQFPYVIRVVSEITSSNGSSSMASVCGSSLALMDAGVPTKTAVAGIAMGLIKEEKRFAILTDIIGDEDHLGDMDFKVAGTTEGVTALQMDIKIDGITKFIMDRALQQAKEGRLHILSAMNQVIAHHRPQLSTFAPTIRTMKINPEKIRDVIGKGGVTIRAITEETGASIDINDEGVVNIASTSQESGQQAWDRIQQIVGDIEVGQEFQGRVIKIMEFGAFVNLFPGKDGFLHVSQIADERVERVTDYLKEGQEVKVKVLEVDRQGRIRVGMKPSLFKSAA